MVRAPKVCIVLVNYNGYLDTIECIESIRKCTYTNYHIVIIDNASIDDSVERLEEYINESNEVLIRSDYNGGFAAGNNLGIKYSIQIGAEYIVLLNNDTLVKEDFIQKLIAPFYQIDRCGLTIGKIYYASNSDTIWYDGGVFNKITSIAKHCHYREKDYSSSNSKLKQVSFATGCCMCISKELIEKVGLLNECYFLYEEDVDYCIRIDRANYKMIYNPKSIIYHKVNSSTNEVSDLSMKYIIRNRYLLIDKYYYGVSKIIPVIYSNLRFAKRMCKGEISLKIWIKAYKEYRAKRAIERNSL